jgi:hypothetical protein
MPDPATTPQSTLSVELREGTANPVERMCEILAAMNITGVTVTPSIDDAAPGLARFVSVVLARDQQVHALSALARHPDVKTVLPEPDATP